MAEKKRPSGDSFHVPEEGKGNSGAYQLTFVRNMKKYFSVRHFPGQRRLMFEAKQKNRFSWAGIKGPVQGKQLPAGALLQNKDCRTKKPREQL